MARPTFKGYMENVESKTGKTAEDFWKSAIKKGFVKQGKEMLKWLKSEVGLGHVHANFIIQFLRLRANEPKASAQSRKWA